MLPGATSKEEGADDEISDGFLEDGRGGRRNQSEDEECDCFLVSWWWVLVAASFDLVVDDWVEGPFVVAGGEDPIVTPKLL